MQRVFGILICLVLFAVTAMPTLAQGRRGRYSGRTEQYRRYEQPRRVYYDRHYRGRSVWDRHRDKLTLAAGTGGGAVIGGLAGGKKGAVIGALLGAGGSALYTYKLRDRRDRRYHRRY